MGRDNTYKRQRAHVLRENPKFFEANENGGPPSRISIIDEFSRLTADNAYGRNPQVGADRPEGGIIPMSPPLKAVDTNKLIPKISDVKPISPGAAMDKSAEQVKKELGAKPKPERPAPKDLVLEPKGTQQFGSFVEEDFETPATGGFDWAADLTANLLSSPDKPVKGDDNNAAPAPETFEGVDGWNAVRSNRNMRAQRAPVVGFSTDSRACFNCGEEGHRKSECPAPPKSSGRACYKCGEEGHIARECPNQDAGFGGRGNTDNRACYNCNQTGHISRDCPTGGPGKGGAECFNRGEIGHKSFECTKGGGSFGGARGGKSGGGRGLCYKCGQPGHFSRECVTGEAFPAFDDAGFGTDTAFETEPGFGTDVGSGTAADDDAYGW